MKIKILFFSLAGIVVLTANSFAGQGMQPSICTRPCWGARAPICGISQLSALNRAVIHHTAGPSDYTTDYGAAQARVRGVQNYHMDSAGMCDIAYHFLVSAGGHIFEGRSGSMSSLPRGAHDGVNANSFGFNWMGYFHPPYNQDPPPAMRNSLYDVIAWRMPSAWSPYGGGTYNGRTAGFLCGHRDALATACPGDIAYNYITANLNGGEARDAVNARKNPAPPPPSLHLDVYIKGTDNQLWHNWHGGIAWSGWLPLGGALGSEPTAVCWGPGRVDVFWRGTDNALWHKWYNNGIWEGPESLGGTVVGSPDACSWGAGHLDVYVRGTDNGLWHRGLDGNGVWSGWLQVPGTAGTVTSDPSVASWSPFRIDAFYRGTGNTLKHLFWNGTWSGVEDLGGGLAGAPDVASWGPGRLDVVIRGTDNALWHQWYNDTAWGVWENLGGVLTADPSIAAPQANRLDIFVRGTDNALHHKWYTGAWSIWEWLGGGLSGGPDVCSWSN